MNKTDNNNDGRRGVGIILQVHVFSVGSLASCPMARHSCCCSGKKSRILPGRQGLFFVLCLIDRI